MTIFKTILITGASSGIGEALAVYYAKAGAENLFICGRNAERLKNTADVCRKFGANVYEKILDVTDQKAVRDWIEKANQTAPLNLVVANAGVSTGTETKEHIYHTFQTNVFGVLNTVLPAVEVFRSQKNNALKAVAVTASIAGYHGLPGCPSYSASKACVKAYGEALRVKLKKENIRVSVICPGFVYSRITDKNTCPMPFIMASDKAAKIIARGLEKNVGLIAFPFVMRFAVYLASVLPNAVSQFLYGLLPNKIKL